MSYPSTYTPHAVPKKQHPKLLIMLTGFAISTIIGIVAGQISSAVYCLIGQGGGMECLTLPLSIFIYCLSGALSLFLTRLLNKMFQKQ